MACDHARRTLMTPGLQPCDSGLCERVRARAYEIFESRRATGEPGDALSDWLRAERECVTLDVHVNPNAPLPKPGSGCGGRCAHRARQRADAR